MNGRAVLVGTLLALFVYGFVGGVALFVVPSTVSEPGDAHVQVPLLYPSRVVADSKGLVHVFVPVYARLQTYEPGGRLVRNCAIPEGKGVSSLAVDARDGIWLLRGRRVYRFEAGCVPRQWTPEVHLLRSVEPSDHLVLGANGEPVFGRVARTRGPGWARPVQVGEQLFTKASLGFIAANGRHYLEPDLWAPWIRREFQGRVEFRITGAWWLWPCAFPLLCLPNLALLGLVAWLLGRVEERRSAAIGSDGQDARDLDRAGRDP